MGWSDWNWISVFFVFFSAALSVKCFREENSIGGWFNLFASALNFALVAVRLGF